MISAITTNRGTFDIVLIIAAAIFFLSCLLHLFKQPNPVPIIAIAFSAGMAGLTALAVGLLFI